MLYVGRETNTNLRRHKKMGFRQAIVADLDVIERGYIEHFAHEKNMVLTPFLGKGFIPQEKLQKQLYRITLCMFMRKMALYWVVLF